MKTHWSIGAKAAAAGNIISYSFLEGLVMETKAHVKRGRNLISAGVFSAIYFLIFTIISIIFIPIPILYLLMPMAVAVIAGPVYMLLIAKTQMPGPIFIAAILPGLFLIATGHPWITLMVCAVAGLIAEFIARMGAYQKFWINTLSYLFFAQNLIGAFLPIWMMREYYFQDNLNRGISEEYCQTLRALTPPWVLIVMIIGIAAGAAIGALLGRGMFKKHFKKAGIV